MKKISVIVPFFGKLDPRRFELVLESVKNQSEKNIEFLICGGKNTTVCNNIGSHFFNVQDILAKIKSEKITPLQSIPHGLLYNQGIRIANGEYIYLSDSDVIFSEEYLKNLVFASEELGIPLQRPMMRRLLLQDFETFYDTYSSEGIKDALDSLDFSQEFIVKTDNNTRVLRVFKKMENGRMKTFVASDEDFREYSSSPKNKGSEPKFFNQERHCGAVFAKKMHLEDVGGCCEGFIGWGCWDADLQWKLRETYGMSYIPGEVIHLDHSKEYFNSDEWRIDREFQKERRAKGVIQCIKEDKEVYTQG